MADTRRVRQAQVGWSQRLMVLTVFVLICVPVLLKYVCALGAAMYFSKSIPITYTFSYILSPHITPRSSLSNTRSTPFSLI